MSEMSLVAVIPARKGSKRFPGKNRAKIGEKTLAQLAIECAIDARIFNQIILTTDDEEFKHYNSIYEQLDVRERPEAISDDSAEPYEVLKDLQSYYSLRQNTRFCYLQPTSPLRQPADLVKSNSCNAISIYFDDANILRNMHNVKTVLNEKRIDDSRFKCLGDLSKYYFNGLFYWVDLTLLEKQKGLLGSSTKFLKTPISRSYDIDYEHEYLVAKQKYSILMRGCI
ncbi:hypothetical protein N9M64_00220 [bacterium]|nr:hypothetical protein [bacterium]